MRDRKTTGLFSLPLKIVDVGAAGGLHKRWGPTSGNALSALLFEPDPAAAAKLWSGSSVLVSQIALSSETGESTLYCTRKSTCSSLHRANFSFIRRFPNAQRFEITSQIPVIISRLDDEIRRLDFSSPDFVKLDVQGHEAAVLSGAQQTLRAGIIGIESEISFGELYENGAKIGDLIDILAPIGFEIFDLRRVYWKRPGGRHYRGKGQLAVGDALFLLPPETVADRFAQNQEKLTAAFRIYCAYHHYDASSTLLDAIDPGPVKSELELILHECAGRRDTALSKAAYRLWSKYLAWVSGWLQDRKPTSGKRWQISGDPDF